MEYSPDAEWIVSVCKDERREGSATGQLIIYKAATGQVWQTVPAKRACALSICFSAAGSRVYVGGADGRIRMWPFESGVGKIAEEPSTVLELEAGPVTRVAVSPDDHRLAAGTETGVVYVFSVSSANDFQQTYRRDGLGAVTDLAFSAKSERLAASAQEAGAKGQERPGGVWVWRLDDGQLVGNRTDDDGPCRGVMFSEDGAEVVVGSDGLYRWNPISNIKADLIGTATWGVRSIDSPGNVAGRYVALAIGEGRVLFYDRKLATLRPSRGFHDSAVADHIGVCFSPDGRFVASVGRDGLRVWDFLPAHEVDLVDDSDRDWRANGVDLSSDASALVAWLSKDFLGPTNAKDDRVTATKVARRDRLVIHNLSHGKRTTITGDPNQVLGPATFAPDGKRIGLAKANPELGTSRLMVIDAGSSGDEHHSPAFAGQPTKAICWLGRGAGCLLCVLPDGSLVIWRVRAANNADVPSLERIGGFAHRCSSLSEWANGEWLVANEDSENTAGHVKLWRSTGRSLVKYPFDQAYELASDFPAHDYTWCAALLGDGEGGLMVATVGSVHEVHLWHPTTGELLGKLPGHRDAIDYCRALDERLLVTASWDGTVRVWDLIEREELCVLDRPRDSPFAVAGGRIAIARENTVTIVDTREIARFIAGNEATARGRLGE